MTGWRVKKKGGNRMRVGGSSVAVGGRVSEFDLLLQTKNSTLLRLSMELSRGKGRGNDHPSSSSFRFILALVPF